MFPYFPKTCHDHATLGHSDIINSDLFHTLITSYIRANIYMFIYSTCLSKHYQKYLHQSRPYQHLSTLNHPLVIILLGNSNNQSWVTYIRHPIQISTVQSEEQHVVNHLPKFHLNWTVNKSENAVLRKLHKLETMVAPSAQKWGRRRLAGLC